ncbi:MAG: hypothetical protein COA80_13700 [Leeuwenhoekiella sp.]|nr:MAG: hypothetical protein COA80_13700 [Leeuwenhoekiella sp.]
MNISYFFDLGSQQPDLDFVDIKLETDNLLFIDPRLIEFSQSRYSSEMHFCIESFWGEFIKRVRSKDKREIYSLLAGLKEPQETRLGYSRSAFQGKSVANKLKPKLVEALRANKAIQSGVLSHFADVELFIEDISSDRISDITTKIIKSVLIRYTQQQCKLLGIPMKLVKQDDIYNPHTNCWDKEVVSLPVHLDEPILFVPKDIVRGIGNCNKNVNCFYRFAIRNFVKRDPFMLKDVSASGKEGKILIRDIKSRYPISKTSLTEWSLRYGKLLVDYKTNYLKGILRPMTDFEIMKVVYDDFKQAI